MVAFGGCGVCISSCPFLSTSPDAAVGQTRVDPRISAHHRRARTPITPGGWQRPTPRRGREGDEPVGSNPEVGDDAWDQEDADDDIDQKINDISKEISGKLICKIPGNINILRQYISPLNLKWHLSQI
jgi:hypothetical protein